MRQITIVLIAISSVLTGIALATASGALQDSDVTGAGALAAILGLASLLTTACPVALGATWVLERVQQDRLRRTSCV